MIWKKTIAILIGLALIVGIVLKLKSNKEIAVDRVYQYDEQEAIPVIVDVLEYRNFESKQAFSGTFEPYRESKLSAESQGKVNEITVEVGDYVQKGQTLIQLDKALLELKVKSVDVKIEELRMDRDRYTILTEADAIQGVKLEKVNIGLKSLNIEKATLLEQINKKSIKAPFNGVITAKFTEIGSFAAPGMPLLQLTNIDKLKFTINIAEKDLSQFEKGTLHTISPDIFPELRLDGKTTMMASKANDGSSYPVQFTVNNIKGRKLKSGMFGSIQVPKPVTAKGLLLVSSALIGGSDQPQVYIIKGARAILRDVDVSGRIKDKILISGGLQQGDTVVVGGLINLFDGANVSFN